MSYGQQQRSTESWNNDPNSFSNTGSRFGGENQRDDRNLNPSAQGNATDDPTSQARWNPGAVSQSWDQSPNTPATGQQGRQGQFDNQWTAGPGDNYGNTGYQGNTSSVDNMGAGGDFGSTGRRAGAGADQWDQGNNQQGNNQQGNNLDTDQSGYGGSGMGSGQPSMTERLKGNAEKLAGRVKRDPNMVTRGEERKTGGDPTGTSWNDYDQNQ